jgi:WD40 repeat protein
MLKVTFSLSLSVSVGDDKSIKIWTQETTDSVRRHDPKWTCTSTIEDAHSRTIYSVSWSHYHGLIATGAGDNKIGLFALVSGRNTEDLRLFSNKNSIRPMETSKRNRI